DPQKAPSRLGYRLEAQKDSLSFYRVLIRGDKVEEIKSYQALGKLSGLAATRQDLAVEAVLGSYASGPIPERLVSKLLMALRDIPDLQYQDKEISVTDPEAGLCLRVEEAAEGFRLRLDQDPDVVKFFSNRILLKKHQIAHVSGHGLSDKLFRELKEGKIYPFARAGELVGRVLPEMRQKLRVIVDTQRLPREVESRARIQLETSRAGDKLMILPLLVYGDPPIARVDGDSLQMLSTEGVPKRNKRREAQLREILKDELHLSTGIKEIFDTADAIKVRKKIQRLERDGWEVEGEAHEEFFEGGALKPVLQTQGGVDFFFEEQSSLPGSKSTRIDPEAALKAFERGESLVPLSAGGFAKLPADWLYRYGDILKDLLSSWHKDEKLGGQANLPPWAMGDLARLAEALNAPPPPQIQEFKALLKDAPEEIKLPKDLTATLRDYQLQGTGFLERLKKGRMGALLADDMGLGKTLQALCTIQKNTLLVAPTSVLHNWKLEAERFRPDLKVATYHGSNRSFDKNADLTLTTYAILRLDQELLSSRMWDLIILDESQNIKNPSSQTAKAAYSLQASARYALSGTPVENKLEDLWSQMHFLNPGLLGGRNDFNERYSKPILDGDEQKSLHLQERIRPFILRRKKSEVASELPPRTDIVLHCSLSEEERRIYDAIRSATRKDVMTHLGKTSTMEALEALLRLRQAATHPALLPGQAKYGVGLSAKFEVLKSRLEVIAAEGRKALVFSQWTSVLNLLQPHLAESEIKYLRLDGSTKNRGEITKKFQEDPDIDVLLISLKAGGTGLNLTAADHVFIVDPWWNPAVEDQAADRAHRIGQDKPVMVYRLVAENTVEDSILALQNRKRELAEVATGVGQSVLSLSQDDILALLD
ncbi:DEAD/DEAH box helicase, partial [Myxococcota bacterium]|nr:DEAD/DEAH box helicase [Myxococcota bacterium]